MFPYVWRMCIAVASWDFNYNGMLWHIYLHEKIETVANQMLHIDILQFQYLMETSQGSSALMTGDAN